MQYTAQSLCLSVYNTLYHFEEKNKPNTPIPEGSPRIYIKDQAKNIQIRKKDENVEHK